MEININLDSKTPDYAMFTDLGNAAVHAIVVAARVNNLTWAETHDALSALAEQEQFGEATDTAVRECVYDALGFYAKGENFYGA
jgi:hypothetical protein